MNRNTYGAMIGISAAVLATLGIVSCGGGGGGGQLAGIDRLGVSSGTISGFGSIFVNGVEWETGAATITVDDNAGIESDLRIGQVVTVRGTLNDSGTQGQAESVEFDSSLEGPIASINLAGNSFVVLGQAVIVSLDTEFDDSIPDRVVDGRRDLSDLQATDVVEVSGFRDSAGTIRATRVEIRGGAGGDFEVKGIVSNLDSGARTFQVGSLAVNYAGAALQDFGSDTLSDGDFVEVEGNLNGAVLDASKVELEDNLPGEDGDTGEVEGFITRFASAQDFDVDGVRVTTNGGTEFEHGTAADLALNVKVEVEGEVNAAGVVVADKVEFRVQPEDNDVELVGDVAAVNVASGILMLDGMDIEVKVTDVTRLEGDDTDSFSLADLNVGDHVEIRGAEDPNTVVPNDVVATRIERKDAEDRVELRGPIQAESQPELAILGVIVATDFAEFRDQNDNVLTDAAFYAAIGVGDVVKARTTSNLVLGNRLTAERMEIEEDN